MKQDKILSFACPHCRKVTKYYENQNPMGQEKFCKGCQHKYILSKNSLVSLPLTPTQEIPLLFEEEKETLHHSQQFLQQSQILPGKECLTFECPHCSTPTVFLKRQNPLGQSKICKGCGQNFPLTIHTQIASDLDELMQRTDSFPIPLPSPKEKKAFLGQKSFSSLPAFQVNESQPKVSKGKVSNSKLPQNSSAFLPLASRLYWHEEKVTGFAIFISIFTVFFASFWGMLYGYLLDKASSFSLQIPVFLICSYFLSSGIKKLCQEYEIRKPSYVFAYSFFLGFCFIYLSWACWIALVTDSSFNLGLSYLYSEMKIQASKFSLFNLILFWGGEFFILFFLLWYQARKVWSTPFCENCQTWTNDEIALSFYPNRFMQGLARELKESPFSSLDKALEDKASFAGQASIQKFIEYLEKENFLFLENLNLSKSNTLFKTITTNYLLTLNIFSCPDCQVRYCRLVYQDNFRQITLVKCLEITEETYHHLKALVFSDKKRREEEREKSAAFLKALKKGFPTEKPIHKKIEQTSQKEASRKKEIKMWVLLLSASLFLGLLHVYLFYGTILSGLLIFFLRKKDYKWELLNRQAMHLYRQKHFDQAIEFFEKARKIAEETLGKDHINYITSLNNLAMLYNSREEYTKAEPLYLEARKISAKVLGKEHLNYAVSLSNLAMLYKSMGEDSKIEPLLLETIKITEKVRNKNHPSYTNSLNELATLYKSMNKYEKAEPLYLETKEIAEKVLGKEHPGYVTSLSNLAMLYKSMGKYEKAELLYLEAIEITENTLEQDHPSYTTNLNDLAFLALYKPMIERVLGKDHPAYANRFNKLTAKGKKQWEQLNQQGIQLYQQGNFVPAIQVFEKARKMAKEALGEDNPDYGNSLSNLAVLYQSMGENTKAEPLFGEAKKIKEKILGRENPDYASSLNNLAMLYNSMGEYGKAEPLFLEAKQIYEKVLGKDEGYPQSLKNHLAFYKYMKECATTLNNLAMLYKAIGKYGKAEPLYLEAIEVTERVLGKDHPSYATSFNNLAMLYKSMGEYGKAEPLYLEAMEITERVLGKDHPSYAINLNNLAMLYQSMGKQDSVLPLILEAAQIQDQMALRLFSIGEEKRVESYIQTSESQYFNLLSLFYQNQEKLCSFNGQICELVLKRKSLNWELMALKRDKLLILQYPQLNEKFTQLKQLNQQIFHLTQAGPQNTSPEEYQQRVSSLEQQREVLEKELAEKVPQLDLEQKLSRVTSEAVAKMLPVGSALIEFVFFREVDPSARHYLSTKYIAFIIKQKRPEEVAMVELGSADEIDALISIYKKELFLAKNAQGTDKEEEDSSCEDLSQTLTDIQKIVAHSGLSIVDIQGKMLYEKIFAPLLEKTEGSKRLILSTDGAMRLLPLEVLKQPDGRFLLEDYHLSYVNSGKDVLRFPYRQAPKTEPVIIANPEFDLAGGGRPLQMHTIPGKRDDELEKEVDGQEVDDKKAPYYFPPLTETQREGMSIATVLSKHRSLMGEKALDSKIKELQAPAILHLATHCFFMKDVEEKSKEELLPRMMDFSEEKVSKGKSFKNALLRSGLALSGINTFFQKKEPAEGAEDGLLSSLDITGMDLEGTDLVVLSGCETGGELKIEQGVYGLRHSFIIAGAKTVLLSMWKSPDKESHEFLLGFYQKIIQGEEKAVALRKTQQEIIERLRSEGKDPHPYLWGAFICIGEPGKIIFVP